MNCSIVVTVALIDPANIIFLNLLIKMWFYKILSDEQNNNNTIKIVKKKCVIFNRVSSFKMLHSTQM
jgi:hypothetical protein